MNPFLKAYYFPDISSSCWEIVVDTLVELGWLSILCPLFVTHRENSYHISDNISATRWDIKEIKPVLKSHINMLSGMGSFVMMLPEMFE